MSKIDDVKNELMAHDLFHYDSTNNYVRLLDTPNIWGMPFGPEIMPRAYERQAEFERAIVEIIQKARYRCDLSSLNSPDPDWGKPILGAIDTALSTQMGRTEPTQFRFLFGQTPLYPIYEPENLIAFKDALKRLIEERSAYWEVMPEFIVGRFYERVAGSKQSLQKKLLPPELVSSYGTKMTWNHSKIIAIDGVESLSGGHNLNMDLFRSYPPVHDVSAVVHGDATYGAQLYLNKMWEADTCLLTKECFDIASMSWINQDDDPAYPSDPLALNYVQDYMHEKQTQLLDIHQTGIQSGEDSTPPTVESLPPVFAMQSFDLRSLSDLNTEVFAERLTYQTYEQFENYKPADRILIVGKYWTGLNRNTDFKIGSELMKKNLILNAQKVLRLSQQDIISAWKKDWRDHSVCHWILEALLKNKSLKVQIVVSALDAGAGAAGDQYSFGSGAVRTFGLLEYYMTHDVDTDELLDDADGQRAEALSRLYIAPFVYTDQIPEDKTIEGETYKWPQLPEEGKTATLKQRTLTREKPQNGLIGHPFYATINASGYVYDRVECAPANHAKVMIVDDEVCIIGSDNLYPGFLSEFNNLIEGEFVNELLIEYWEPLWKYSSPFAYNGVQP
ncbi:phospholipase D-like domain-containing protein [Photobacterium leiognathi]|uniref:phospholipase n=1 Tax=Photobacterium leiognathi TaxID=553611 RepID=UPI0029826E29|nr:phospholipase [Photobacterium leiognathi]